MSARTSHIIQRQVFEITASTSKNGFEWEARASAYLHQVINPVIEACFRNAVGGHEHLVIDKIEIDLGSFSPQTFQQEAAERLSEKLSSVLRSYVESSSRKDDSDGAGNMYHKMKQSSGTENPRLLSHVQSLQLALLHFLSKGRFPWWYNAGSAAQAGIVIENEITGNTVEADGNEPGKPGWLDEQFKALPLELSGQASQFKEALRTSAAVRIRLVNHFSPQWLTAFLQSLGLEGEKAMEQWKILFAAVSKLTRIHDLFHQYFWLAWIEAAFHGMHGINISLLIERTAGGYNEATLSMAKRIHEVCYEHKHETIFAGYVESIRKYLHEGDHYDAFRKSMPDELTTAERELYAYEIDETANIIDKTLDDILQPLRPDKKEKRSSEDDDALFVEAAGIVILHPFLAELFKETGLWNDEKWCNDESAYRAVQMLSWLAFGEAGLPEHRLLLFKVFTGLDAEEPLPAIAPLTQQEINACTELLQAIIKHWKALRSTGIDGLQQAFLQREGKLTQTEKNYQLIVERKAQDVLLSHLPWGYSMVRLPWMPQIINVTWI